MAKPKVAFFDFASCEGCQLSAIDLAPEQMLDLLNVVDIVEFREAISEKAAKYDIALIEGSITRDCDVPRLQDIRNRSKVLVAFGACAHTGGINALKNFQKKEDYQKAVYPTDPLKYETTVTRAISEVVQVDAFIPGCPINTMEFVRIVKNLVLGKRPDIPDYSVCVECKKNENICVYEKGMHCLGPVIRAGCDAKCPSNGGYCYGCRGTVTKPNLHAQKDVMQKYNLTFDQMTDQFKLFLQRNREVFKNAG
ncbi:MAG: NADH:ubiquinone oxidoreductase [bacterium]|nr:NADH:ubiquinone oxidoreductase [bacterium]